MDAVSATIVAGRRARLWQHTEASIYKLINLVIYSFDCGLGKNMCKDAHPLVGIDSSSTMPPEGLAASPPWLWWWCL
jgi:hypothetical protein